MTSGKVKKGLRVNPTAMAGDVNEAVSYAFGLAAVLMSILFYLHAHKTHVEYDEKFRSFEGRVGGFGERVAKIKKRAKQVSIVQQAKAGLREAEKAFSKATAKALSKVAVKARARVRK